MQDFPLKKITRVIRGITMTLPYWNENTPEDMLYDVYIRQQNNQRKSEEYQRQYKLKCEKGILRNKKYKYNKSHNDGFIDY